MAWQPITEAELWDEILAAEGRMTPQIFRLWEAIKVSPEKWSEKTYGIEGGGFWVVAIVGQRALWYNDIEDGFNCSSYDVAGTLDEYFCNQDELEHAVQKVLELIETGRDTVVRCSAPIPGPEPLSAGSMDCTDTEPDEVPVVKDDAQRAIPSAWRPVLARIVDAFVRHDYRLEEGIAGVAPVSEDTATHIRDFVADYGATLTALPLQAWDTSVCIWMDDHWDAMVDLWTEEEGASDLVLAVRVREAGTGYVVDVHMVYVP